MSCNLAFDGWPVSNFFLQCDTLSSRKVMRREKFINKGILIDLILNGQN